MKSCFLLASVLFAVGCAQAQPDPALVGTWEAFTETHRRAVLDLRQDGSAAFLLIICCEGQPEEADSTMLTGHWTSKDAVVTVEFPEGVAQYRYAAQTKFDPTTEALFRGLTPIAGHEWVGHNKVWNPPFEEQMPNR